jgi:hypothetical protein
MKKYFFVRDGKVEDVEVEQWAWSVVYKSGEKLQQFDDNGTFHQIGEVDQDKVISFAFYKPRDLKKSIEIFLPKGARLIHRYIRTKLHASTPQEINLTIYVFGYKIGDHYHYNYILPNDRIVQATNSEIEHRLIDLII